MQRIYGNFKVLNEINGSIPVASDGVKRGIHYHSSFRIVIIKVIYRVL